MKMFTWLQLLCAAAMLGVGAGRVACQGDTVPTHLRGRPFDLSVRRGDRIVAAPVELLRLARSYPAFAGKGPVVDGRRITLMAVHDRYTVGQPVRVVHVLEAVIPGRSVYAMGPKSVSDEYVDGVRVTPGSPGAGSYDGVVLEGPAVHFNYEITSYTFSTPGVHTIEWRGGGHSGEGLRGLHSNIVRISVVR